MPVLVAQNHTQEEYKMPDGKTIPNVEKIDDIRVKIGTVEINHQERTISFPGLVNMNTGIIEYIVGMPHGKVHETLVITEADPLHMSVAMKLLSFTSFERFFPEMDESGTPLPFSTPKPHEYIDSYVQINLTWQKDNGERASSDLSDMLVNKHRTNGFPVNQWLYTNSYFYHGVYQASLTGDIIAVFADKSSLINYIGDYNDGRNDTGWTASPQTVPKPGTPVTIIISQKKITGKPTS